MPEFKSEGGGCGGRASRHRKRERKEKRKRRRGEKTSELGEKLMVGRKGEKKEGREGGGVELFSARAAFPSPPSPLLCLCSSSALTAAPTQNSTERAPHAACARSDTHTQGERERERGRQADGEGKRERGGHPSPSCAAARRGLCWFSG